MYVTAYDKSAYNPGGTTTSNANPGWIFGYAVGSSGALTAVSGSPYQAGVKPSALATDPTSRFIFVTDYASNELIGYTVLSTNVLSFMINGPFKTGNEPTSITIDPRGIYMYVTNSLDSTLSSYSIALPTGTPSTIVGSGCDGRKHHRYRPGVGRRRALAGPLRLHCQSSGQLHLRLQAQSRYRRFGHHAGHALPHRRDSHGGHRGSAWQPCHAVDHSVRTVNQSNSGSVKKNEKPSRDRLGFLLRNIFRIGVFTAPNTTHESRITIHGPRFFHHIRRVHPLAQLALRRLLNEVQRHQRQRDQQNVTEPWIEAAQAQRHPAHASRESGSTG